MTIDPASDLREISTQFIRQQAVAALADNLPSIILDGSRLSKMLMAIRDNAVKFSDKDGKTSLNTAVTYTNELRISVTNTGVGISQDLLAQVLKTFHQSDAGRNRWFECIGLGPAIANAIAGIHSARQEVRNQVNEGTTVELAVPESWPLANHVERIESSTIAA